MKLSVKATRFVIEALEHYLQYQDQQLKDKGLTEDDVSDLLNDREYLQTIKQDFRAVNRGLQCNSFSRTG